MPTIMPIMNALDRREYIAVERSGYNIPKIRDKFPITEELKPSEPIANPANIIMNVTESLEYIVCPSMTSGPFSSSNLPVTRSTLLMGLSISGDMGWEWGFVPLFLLGLTEGSRGRKGTLMQS